jgi:hypothetical protein
LPGFLEQGGFHGRSGSRYIRIRLMLYVNGYETMTLNRLLFHTQ